MTELAAAFQAAPHKTTEFLEKRRFSEFVSYLSFFRVMMLILCGLMCQTDLSGMTESSGVKKTEKWKIIGEWNMKKWTNIVYN